MKNVELYQNRRAVLIDGGERPVDHGNVTGKQSRAGHALARNAHDKGGFRILNQQLVEIEGQFQIIIGRRGKARRDRATGQLHTGLGEGLGNRQDCKFILC